MTMDKLVQSIPSSQRIRGVRLNRVLAHIVEPLFRAASSTSESVPKYRPYGQASVRSRNSRPNIMGRRSFS